MEVRDIVSKELITYVSDFLLEGHEGEEREGECPLPDFDKVELVAWVGDAFDTLGPNLPKPVQLWDFRLAWDGTDEDDRIHIIRLTSNCVEVYLNGLPDWRILTYTDAYYPGWRAYVDGKEIPIYLANDAFKAVVVPPGSHLVRFEFLSWRVYAGLAISFFTLAGCILYLCLNRYRRCARAAPNCV